MINVTKEWNPEQAKLKELLRDSKSFSEAIELCLNMHSMVHSSEMSKCNFKTYEDFIWDNLNEGLFRFITAKNTSIVWNLWHITRIEDLTSNILISDNSPVLDNDLLSKLNTTVKDTGNAMAGIELKKFSNEIDIKELKKYRIKVGRQTRKIIQSLQPEDLKRKVTKKQLQKIKDNGGIIDHEKSIWLLDFWGRKTVSGILSMPVTRHQIVHLNDSFKIINKYMKQASKTK